MNKKQLQESIMAGVKQAFRTNKTLNEGFASWREQNAPNFPFEKFNEAMNPLVSLWSKYISDGYLLSWSFNVQLQNGTKVLREENKESVTSEKSIMNLIAAERNLKTLAKNSEDAYNRAMYKSTFFLIKIPVKSVFGQYVKSTLNPSNDAVIDHTDVIDISWKDERIIEFKINTEDIVKEDLLQKVYEYFK